MPDKRKSSDVGFSRRRQREPPRSCVWLYVLERGGGQISALFAVEADAAVALLERGPTLLRLLQPCAPLMQRRVLYLPSSVLPVIQPAIYWKM